MISRMAPSNTGKPTLGNARTLLLAHLTALKENGETILRIESTDAQRSSEEFTGNIIDSLRFLGIYYNPNVIDQSEQQSKGVYKEIADLLVASGYAYYCKCSTDDLKRIVARQKKEKSSRQGYEGACRSCEHTEGVLRLNSYKTSQHFGMKKVSFEDRTYGHRTIDFRDIQDAVLLRADGSATYMLSNVVDDVLSEVTHIVRGVDLIPQTFFQIILAMIIREVIGKPAVTTNYTHLPLLISSDGKKLSKRDKDTLSILDYKTKGFLPDAICQYLCSIGNSSVPLSKPLDRKELVAVYDNSKTSMGNVEPSYENLIALNRKHINKSSIETLRELLVDLRFDVSMISDGLIDLYKSRSNTLVELYEQMVFVINSIGKNRTKTEELRGQLLNVQSLQASCLFSEFRRLVLGSQHTAPVDKLLEAC